MLVGYVRVSTIEQNEARQLETMERYGVEKVYTEKVSGKNIEDRAELKAMLDFVREGDTIVVHDFSRLARSTKDLLNIVELLEQKKVNLVSSKEQVDSSTPSGKLMLTMIGAIAEFERANLLERQREGIAIAKAKGIYKKKCGRKEVAIDSKFMDYYDDYKARKINKVQFAKAMDISRPTLDKLIKEYEDR